MESSFYDRISKSKFYSAGDKLGDIMLLSLCWVATSIPLVTMGPATSALYYAVHKRYAEKSETPVRDFFHSFKQNLLQGIILTIILILYAGITAFNILFAWKGFGDVKLPSWYLPIAILLALPFIFCVPYVFPYLARFKNNVGSTLFHSFTFSTMYARHTLLMWLFMILSLALMIFFFPSLAILPYLCCFLCWKMIERDFGYALILRDKREHPEKYQDENEDSDEDSEDDADEESEEDESDEEEEEEDDDSEESDEEDSEVEIDEDDEPAASEVDEDAREE
ncbi:MAG: YesL family protein [Clostridiales bacterium]|nr:YesL family protein [Clostridiales bacterium]